MKGLEAFDKIFLNVHTLFLFYFIFQVFYAGTLRENVGLIKVYATMSNTETQWNVTKS